MAMLATTPVEVYLRSSYEPDAEFVDGEVEERAAGEYDHATWQQAIQRWFIEQATEWNIRVRAELRVQVREGNYRVPDVVVWDRSRPIEQILTHPPTAVFEVLSPEDTVARLMQKLRDYDAMGIGNIFVIDPRADAAYRYVNGSLALCRDEAIAMDGTGAKINWSGVRALRD